MSNRNWKSDSIQFPRLISELQAAGAFTPEVMRDLCASMDLAEEAIAELIARAETRWNAILERRAT